LRIYFYTVFKLQMQTKSRFFIEKTIEARKYLVIMNW
jgi:hypothetical protein